MLRLRRYLAPTLLLLPLILLCGKLLLTPVWRQTTSVGQFLAPDKDVGWPFVFLEIKGRTSDTVTKYQLSYWFLLADLTILLGAIGASGLALHWHHRRRGAWLRFSLLELLIFIAAFGAVAGWWTRVYVHWHRQQAAIAEISATRGLSADMNYVAPQWLRRLWPDDDITIFQRPTGIAVASSAPDGAISALPALLRDLPDVKSLVIYYSRDGARPATTRFRLAEPSAFETIEHINFSDRLKLDDAALADLPALPRLRGLLIVGDLPVSSPNRGLGHVGKCLGLEELSISDAALSDDESAQLAGLTRLRLLLLRSNQLTDNSMDTLAKLTSLESLTFTEAEKVTDSAIYRLVQQLPNLKILRPPQVLSPRTIQRLHERNISVFLPQSNR
jgi:hypothetical protein